VNAQLVVNGCERGGRVSRARHLPAYHYVIRAIAHRFIGVATRF